MKKLTIFIICSTAMVYYSSAQISNKKIIGRWKFIKVELPSVPGFDLDNLTTSYKQFFYTQKHDVYHDTITTNDSLYINVLFEKAVNDINRMFIVFENDKHYETNRYSSEDNLTEKTESGIYSYNSSKNEICTYRNGKKNQVSRFKVVYLDKNKLVIKTAQTDGAAVFTCRKVE